MTKENKIEHILCAVRGRPENRETVTRAIDLALQHNCLLTFVHITDADFMALATPTLSSLRIINQQLEEMGEFIMLILVDRATRRGVSKVNYIVCIGKFKKELLKVITHTQADLLVIGRPVGRRGSDLFKNDEFDDFMAELKRENGIKIVTVDTSKLDKSDL
jgi:nucleotide-binding universal stress UspA family protein